MRQRFRFAVVMFVLAPGLSTVLHAGAVVFDFENIGTGTPTGFADTVSGLTATFSSSPDVTGFTVASIPGFFQTLTGNFLLDGAPESLTIAFSAPLTDISLDFGTFDTQALNLDAFLGAAFVGNASANGVVLPGGNFPEGVLSFNTGLFDTVVLSSGTPNFAVDNVSATDPPAVPEPGSLLLCAGALAVLSFVKLRRSIS